MLPEATVVVVVALFGFAADADAVVSYLVAVADGTVPRCSVNAAVAFVNVDVDAFVVDAFVVVLVAATLALLRGGGAGIATE